MRVFVLVIAAFVLGGCEVISDINSEIGFSEEEKAKSKAKAEATAPADEEEPDTYAKRTAEWWGKAKSLGPREDQDSDNPMVRCKVGGTERFTLTRDCLASGGTVL